MPEDRRRYEIYLDAVRREAIWRLPRIFPDRVYVTEYPKSGGSWAAQLLSSSLGIPFLRNAKASGRPAVLHGHHLPRPAMQRVVFIARDGRDALVSEYFHRLFENDRNSPADVERYRRYYGFKDVNDVMGNMATFVERQLTSGPQRFRPVTWPQMTQRWVTAGGVVVHYEDLLSDAPGTLQETVEAMARRREFDRTMGIKVSKLIDAGELRRTLETVCSRFSFEAQAGRLSGTEQRSSFLRRGVAGDHRNYFDQAALDIFWEIAGEAMTIAGYDRNGRLRTRDSDAS